MNQFLLIRNSGLAPIEAFTILGLSTARGEADKIGQFGSGSKHGILTLMRHGLTPRIFIGNDELVFSTHSAKMGDKDYEEVRYTFLGEQHKTGMCLDFGALDWDAVTMALREFICNALDQGERIEECVNACNAPIPHEEETRIYVSLKDAAVLEYWGKLREYFLHFDGLQSETLLPARSKSAQFYRRGVYVTERLTPDHPAIFSYNFQNERIDESRNLDGATVSNIAAKLLFKSPSHLAQIFSTFGGPKRWEHDLGNAMWTFNPLENEAVAEAWRIAYSDLPFACDQTTAKGLEKKKIQFIGVPGCWDGALRRAGVADGKKLLSHIDSLGGDVCDATESAMETFQRVWRWLEKARLTSDKPFPNVKCFSVPMQVGGETLGYCRDGTVYLNLDYDTNEQAALEELSHYITGAEDETRDFQDFAFKLATRLAKLNLSSQI